MNCISYPICNCMCKYIAPPSNMFCLSPSVLLELEKLDSEQLIILTQLTWPNICYIVHGSTAHPSSSVVNFMKGTLKTI